MSWALSYYATHALRVLDKVCFWLEGGVEKIGILRSVVFAFVAGGIAGLLGGLALAFSLSMAMLGIVFASRIYRRTDNDSSTWEPSLSFGRQLSARERLDLGMAAVCFAPVFGALGLGLGGSYLLAKLNG